ncbi:putative A ORF U [Vaccinia virus Copenhagen]|uniref:Uncharacterized 8.8 kDa protein n=1 Tax=Vaccinia virus (strain Copenhagen) TaxID=10249 RepID=YVAU_VACCC|nr:RecName: Full=Uncharacterized 8.8 kDa protein [Vaccinia virus Copenhagen]AAA48192.1 putative A ORF U [Vaccinia virus Copenhagen]WDR17337.1 putative A ORF U [Vaccinia virus Copenhagen]
MIFFFISNWFRSLVCCGFSRCCTYCINAITSVCDGVCMIFYIISNWFRSRDFEYRRAIRIIYIIRFLRTSFW